MRAVVQRVNWAGVKTSGNKQSKIGPGLVVFVGVGQEDTAEDVRYIAKKILSLRLFESDAGAFSQSVGEIAAEIMLVSQFTLYADTRKGRRPSFQAAASASYALPLFNDLVNSITRSRLPVVVGEFGTHMRVELENDGPVTISIDSCDMVKTRPIEIRPRYNPWL